VPNPGWLRPEARGQRFVAAVAARAGGPAPADAAGVSVSGVTLDSRTVREGDLYAALPGSRAHGASFTAAAVAAGARAVLTDATGQSIILASPEVAVRNVPVIVVVDPRAVLGGVAAFVYGDLFAGRAGAALRLFGVTGTNGKTTTTYLLESALGALGLVTGLIGTVETRVGDERIASVRTTPEAPDVHALLAVMAERGIGACTMEVSSHALAQHRVDGVVFDVAAFTNLSQDHLDYHHDMRSYFAAKAALFTPEHARRAVVCVDDAWGEAMAVHAAAAALPVVRVRTTDGPPDVHGTAQAGTAQADWSVVERVPGPASTRFTLRAPGGALVRATCPLPGDFNVANTAIAVVMLVEGGWAAQAAADAVSAAGPVPGRMETVDGTGAPGEPLGIVDYAHTPDAIAAACRALAGSPRPLVLVLGAGGDRDRAKRPAMGAAAARGADVVVVTDDNPRSEDPATIRAAVLGGARAVLGTGAGSAAASEVSEVPDRRAAVERAVDLAWGHGETGHAGTVLLAGKGHELGQEAAGSVTPFDDRLVLREALEATARRRHIPDIQPADPQIERDSPPDASPKETRS